MNEQQWPRLERCLSQLARDQIEKDPALFVLEAWLYLVRQNFAGVAACVQKIETLNATSPPEALANVRYVKGQFETLKGLVHYLSADGKAALASTQRALRVIPMNHKRARLFADLYQLGAYQMIGKLETGLSSYQKGMERHFNRDKNYHAMYLGSLGLIHWIDANLMALEQTAECLLDISKEHPLPGTVCFGFYSLGLAQYQRNELQHAEEMLSKVVKIHYADNPMTFAHSAYALALIHQFQGKPDRAREIVQSVVQDSLETNNTDMLIVARAFEAELALHQGHLTRATRWVEEYHAHPFMPPFRFYMPQLTAVKVSLAQNTAESRRRAADLLDQLHDFLESIHNKRFQIDVLALQALLQDAQGEKADAVEKLSQALVLAEPGGFIRVFVDLGPPMAELLKRLLRETVSVAYIGRILAGFKRDEIRAMQDNPFTLGRTRHHHVPNPW